MPSVIDISLNVNQGSPVSVQLNYSAAPPVDIELSEPDAPVLEVSFANIGPKGDPGDGTVVTVVANEDISKYDPVTGNGQIADSTNLAHRNKIIGLADENISNGFSGQVRTGGKITNLSWDWVAGDRIFLNGSTLSTIAPSTGFSVQIGVAAASDTINIEVQPSILL
jgi:hypothetical protein